MASNSEYFANTIIRFACERVITTADFEDFVGCRNWLLVDCGDGDCICEFIVRRIIDNGQIEILVGLGQNYAVTRNVENGVSWHIDADELAIRMEAA
jgi:hypothetical protein